MQTISQLRCPVCANISFKILADFGEIPLSGYYNLDQNSPVPTARMAVEFCEACAFVRKVKAPSATRDYKEIDRSTAGQLPFYIDDITDRLAQLQSKDELVLEVGVNDGTFLNRLRALEFTKLGGVEPSLQLAEICRQNGHDTFCGYFDQSTLSVIQSQFGRPKTILCRHTLEHIPDPLAFLQAARALLVDGGSLYIELPDTSWILEKLQIHEIWDEHENYFTRQSLISCLEMAGFRILECREQRHRDASNLVCWASAATSSRSQLTDKIAHELELCQQFPTKLQGIQNYIKENGPKWRAPVYAIGAAHVQANYATFSGAGEFLDGLVDDAAWKNGHYLAAPGPLPIINTEKLIQMAAPLTLLATAFPYPDWMGKIRAAREGKGDTWVEPYPGDICPSIEVINA